MNASPLLVPVLNKLKRVRHSGSGWSAECPGHDDRANSLSVSEVDGKAILHCHAGCSTDHVVSAMGLTWAELFADKRPDSSGNVLPFRRQSSTHHPATIASRFVLPDGSIACHMRAEPIDPAAHRKRMWWRRGKENTMGGYPLEALPLYGADELGDLGAVVLCEGEKARDALTQACRAFGFAAVATVCGAGSIPSDASLAALRERFIALWPDWDWPGVSHMQRIGYRLALLEPGNWPFWITWDRATDKGDAADFMATGSDLSALLGSAVPWNGGELPAQEPEAYQAPDTAADSPRTLPRTVIPA